MCLFCLPLMSVLYCPNTFRLPLILELLQQKKTCQHKNDIKAEKNTLEISNHLRVLPLCHRKNDPNAEAITGLKS